VYLATGRRSLATRPHPRRPSSTGASRVRPCRSHCGRAGVSQLHMRAPPCEIRRMCTVGILQGGGVFVYTRPSLQDTPHVYLQGGVGITRGRNHTLRDPPQTIIPHMFCMVVHGGCCYHARPPAACVFLVGGGEAPVVRRVRAAAEVGWGQHSNVYFLVDLEGHRLAAAAAAAVGFEGTWHGLSASVPIAIYTRSPCELRHTYAPGVSHKKEGRRPTSCWLRFPRRLVNVE
jgi:hypothetical protein